jgi:ABC-2 type transport system permease protein
MSAATIGWFAQHEAKLAWRGWLAMATAGKRSRGPLVAAVIAGFVLILHVIAYRLIEPYVAGIGPDKGTFMVLTGSAFLSWTLMLSQAMESVTRSFYSRADLDLILSSPASSRLVFALRVGGIALGTVLMALLLVGPFINILAYVVGAKVLGAYGVLAAMAALATAFAVMLTGLLFRLLGPKRTRLIAQIVAAVVGAGFVIGVQAVAILSYGNMSRVAVFLDPSWVAAAPALDSLVWLPARAALGDGTALITLLAGSFALLIATVALTAGRFAEDAIAAAGVSFARVERRDRTEAFKTISQAQALRRKEWMLLKRDPWLVSQSLMQVLYLLPPALMLWRSYGDNAGALVVLAPVIVMAAGQLAGGLAWLAISGEDAPELVATAPIEPGAVVRAKVEAVLGTVVFPVLPLVLGVALVSPWIALVTLIACALAAAASTAIQLIFRSQAKRTQFRRRQTSSRIATFAEAFASIALAAAAGLAAAGQWAAIFPLLFAGVVVFGARMLAARAKA